MSTTDGSTAPQRHALLIGINEYPNAPNPEKVRLRGCHNDAEAMAAVLRDRFSFDVRVLKDPEASRGGILDELQEFLRRVEEGDAVVLYYSGHGSFLEDKAAGLYHESIVPGDSGRSAEHPNLDIFDKEIGTWLGRLREKQVRNVTLIFDCCFSGDITRDDSDEDPIRQIDGDTVARESDDEILVRLRRLGSRLQSAVPSAMLSAEPGGEASAGGMRSRLREDSPMVLSACREDELSKEVEEDGEVHGALTFFLEKALREALPRATWGDVFEQVRRGVTGRVERQVPQVAGDKDRVLFAEETLARESSLRVDEVSAEGDVVTLAGGSVVGVMARSDWWVLPAGARNRRSAEPLATVRVFEMGEHVARARVVARGRGGALAEGQRAFRVVATSRPVLPGPMMTASAAIVLRDGVEAAKRDRFRRLVELESPSELRDGVLLRVLLWDPEKQQLVEPPRSSDGTVLFQEGDETEIVISNELEDDVFVSLFQLEGSQAIRLLMPHRARERRRGDAKLDGVKVAPGTFEVSRDYWRDDQLFRQSSPATADAAVGRYHLKLLVTRQPADFEFFEQEAVRAAPLPESVSGHDRNAHVLPVDVSHGGSAKPLPVLEPASRSRDYADLDLRIGYLGINRFPVTATAPPGEASLRFRQSAGDLNETLERLEKALPSRGTRGAERSSQGLERFAEVRQFGEALFGFFVRDEVGELYRTSLEQAVQGDKALRLRLHLDEESRRFSRSKLAVYPWEFLFDSASREHLPLWHRASVVRRPPRSAAEDRPASLQPPLRMLGVIPRPENLRHLDVEREREFIEKAIEHLNREVQDLVRPTWLEGRVTLETLRAHLEEEDRWHIFHFIGHGDFATDAETGEADGRVFLTDGGGAAAPLAAGALAQLLDSQRSSLRLAFLNCCKGATAQAAGVSSSVAGALAERGIPAVVAMQFPITDRAAIDFSRIFYDSLTQGLKPVPVDEAVAKARDGVRRAAAGTPEWATPVLYLSPASDGRLFRFDLAGQVFARRDAEPAAPVDGVKPAVRRKKARRKKAAPLGMAVAERDALIKKVWQSWIEGKLEKDSDKTVALDPGMMVLRAAPPEAGPRRLGGAAEGTRPSEDSGTDQAAGTDFETVPQAHLPRLFDRLRGSLLILGESGSGKSVRLLELTRHLLEKARQDARLPVPVVFQLSDEAGRVDNMGRWLEEELSHLYQVPRHRSRGWLREGLVLPLLDGVDEVGDERQESPAYRVDCVKAVNAFLAEGSCRVVVSCRRKAYVDLADEGGPLRLDLETAVLLKPLSREWMLGELAGAGPELAELSALFQRNSALQVLARSPMIFDFLKKVGRHLPAAELEQRLDDHAGGSEGHYLGPSELRKRVIEAYVDHRFEAAGKSKVPMFEWLSWLAGNLKKDGRSLFLIEDIQPHWLPFRWQRMGSLILFSVVFGMIVGAVMLGFWSVSDLLEGKARGVEGWLWLVMTPLWMLLIGALDLARRQWFSRSLPPGGRLSPLQSAVGTVAKWGFWCVLWLGIWAVSDMGQGLRVWLDQPVLAGMVVATLYQLRVSSQNLSNRVRPVEALGWSWKHALPGGAVGAVIGLLIWAGFGLLSKEPAWQTWRIYLPVAAVLGFLFSGLRMRMLKRKARKNQGIHLSAANAVKSAALTAPILGLTFGGAFLASAFDNPGMSLAVAAGVCGILSGVVAALWYGGLDVIRHCSIRVFLVFAGPHPLPRFLADAVDPLRILDRVGGGYMFVHRFVSDHFAPEGETYSEGAKTPQTPPREPRLPSLT